MKGDRIKELREENEMKQEELAKILQISPSAVGMYERDEREPNDELTLKIANFFNVSTDFLLGKSNFRNHATIHKSQDNFINVQGLNKDEIAEIQKQIEYIKWKKSQNNN